MEKHKLLIVSGVALILGIASAVFATNIQVNNIDGRPDWNNFGVSIWITILVTLPAFCVFIVTAIAGAIKAIKQKK